MNRLNKRILNFLCMFVFLIALTTPISAFAEDNDVFSDFYNLAITKIYEERLPYEQLIGVAYDDFTKYTAVSFFGANPCVNVYDVNLKFMYRYDVSTSGYFYSVFDRNDHHLIISIDRHDRSYKIDEEGKLIDVYKQGEENSGFFADLLHCKNYDETYESRNYIFEGYDYFEQLFLNKKDVFKILDADGKELVNFNVNDNRIIFLIIIFSYPIMTIALSAALYIKYGYLPKHRNDSDDEST